MKKNILIILTVIFLVTGCFDNSDEGDIEIIFPKKGSEVEAVENIKLDWKFLNSDLSGAEYKVYLGKDIDNLELLGETDISQIFISKKLDWNSKYFWKVIIQNSNGHILDEYISDFKTPGVISLNYPKENETIEKVKDIELDWNFLDTDETGLEYEVFIGVDEDNLELIGKTTETSITLESKKLDWNKDYIWKIKTEKFGDYATKFYTSNPDDLYEVMKARYLWNDNMPENIDYDQYNNYSEILDSMLYSKEQGGYDQWSFIVSYDEYLSWSSNSQYKGAGFSFLWQNQQLFIKRVYIDSPAARGGLKRGDEILEINGYNILDRGKDYIENNFGNITEGEEMILKVKRKEGTLETLNLNKDIIEIHPVQETKTFEIQTDENEDKKVGYMVFDTFNGDATSELETAITSFGSVGIDEMVLDLRYNGGGSLNICANLANMLAKNEYEGSIFTELTYNQILMDNDWGNTYKFSKHENSLELEKLYVITTKDSASASEYLINGLEPFMDVIIIGDDTHGKPVGMNGTPIKDGKFTFQKPESIVFPIMFKGVNANGKFDGYNYISENEENIYDGLTADFKANDDIYSELGSPEEASLKAALEHIKSGEFPTLVQKRSQNIKVEQFKNKGFKQFIGAY
ncbi:MAG: S41 family peptidase [Fusobacteriota bacterium]